jgi:putative transcriptional regulator
MAAVSPAHRARRLGPASGLAVLALWLLGTGLPGAQPLSSEAPPRSLAGRLLVAAPEMRDPRFVETVIYLVSHDATGALGVVVNRPLADVPLARLLESFGSAPGTADGKRVAVHWGGPVESAKGFVLHTPDYRVDGTLIVRERIGFTGSRKILEAVAADAGPRRYLFAVGYAGWAPGQLEAELARGGWITAGADEALLFDDDHSSKWRRATARRLMDL